MSFYYTQVFNEYLSGKQYNSGKVLNFENKSNHNGRELSRYMIKKVSNSNFIVEIPKAHMIRV